MSYTALVKMREKNKFDFPRESRDWSKYKNISALEKACLEFIRESCEGLRFDKSDSEKVELNDFEGKSVGPRQIPYNMEKDIDRMCLENAIHRFMKSGTAQDAFDVYFCYYEMFLDGYKKSKKLSEMLAEFEVNASALLMKHRDHYVHSVYVFILGMAIFQKNEYVSGKYKEFYNLTDNSEAAYHFLKFWGMTSLFHDIGYPFELPCEQVKSYFGENKKEVPFLAYKGLEKFVELSAELKNKLKKVLDETEPTCMNDVFAMALEKIGEKYNKSKADLKCKLERKAEYPEEFDGFMDHAYFSAVLFLRHLLEELNIDNITKDYLDVVSAILIHNSLFKRYIKKGSELVFQIEWNPLAYLLMLCDELQCWDRVSYGKKSRKEIHAMSCDLKFEKNKIKVKYFYDKNLQPEIGTVGKNEKVQKLLKDIEEVVNVNTKETFRLEASASFKENDRRTHLNMSDSSYWNLYQFAIALNYRYCTKEVENTSYEEMEEQFENMSLEYKLSNILQAKAFAHHLEKLGCFYTDRAVDYEMVDSFNRKQMDKLAEMEHMRWLREKESMGWRYEDDPAYDEVFVEKNKSLRECHRIHNKMILDYDALGEVEYEKDTEPMNVMLKLLKMHDGVKIYRKY